MIAFYQPTVGIPLQTSCCVLEAVQRQRGKQQPRHRFNVGRWLFFLGQDHLYRDGLQGGSLPTIAWWEYGHGLVTYRESRFPRRLPILTPQRKRQSSPLRTLPNRIPKIARLMRHAAIVRGPNQDIDPRPPRLSEKIIDIGLAVCNNDDPYPLIDRFLTGLNTRQPALTLLLPRLTLAPRVMLAQFLRVASPDLLMNQSQGQPLDTHRQCRVHLQPLMRRSIQVPQPRRGWVVSEVQIGCVLHNQNGTMPLYPLQRALFVRRPNGLWLHSRRVPKSICSFRCCPIPARLWYAGRRLCCQGLHQTHQPTVQTTVPQMEPPHLLPNPGLHSSFALLSFRSPTAIVPQRVLDTNLWVMDSAVPGRGSRPVSYHRCGELLAQVALHVEGGRN